MASQVTCPSCRNPLPTEFPSHVQGETSCPSCGREMLALFFPALFKTRGEGLKGESLQDLAEAGCFYHPKKRAATVCAQCGRFLCALCNVEFDNQCLCPSCIESSGRKGKIQALNRGEVLYDNLALSLAILPILIWPLTCLTAPTAIFIAIRYWAKPGGVIPRSKFRLILALFFAGLQVAGWFFLIYFLFFAARRR